MTSKLTWHSVLTGLLSSSQHRGLVFRLCQHPRVSLPLWSSSPSWQGPSFPAWNPICKLRSFSTVSERLGLSSPATISEPWYWLCFITLKFLVAVGASLQHRRLLFLGCVSFCFPWKIRAHSSLLSVTVSQTPAIPLLSSLLLLLDTTSCFAY